MNSERFQWHPDRAVWLKEGEPFLPFMNPEAHLRDHPLSSEEALGLIQTELLRVLMDFLNGETVSDRCRWIFPIADRVYLGRLRGLGRLLKNMTNQNLPPAGAFNRSLEMIADLERRSSWTAGEIAPALTQLYRDFSDALDRGGRSGPKEPVPEARSFDEKRYREHDSGFLRPIVGLRGYIRDRLASFISGVWLHGSLSTLDYCPGWSDVDLLLLIRRETVFDPVRLLEARKRILRSFPYLYAVDPLQHHGYFCITELDLEHYAEPYFPRVLFGYATALHTAGPRGMESVRLRDASFERRRVLWEVCHYYRSVSEGKENIQGAFLLKGFLSGLMLLPTLYFQAGGQPMYKKYSFEKARPIFSASWQDLIRRLSEIRSLGVRSRQVWKLCQRYRSAGFPLAGTMAQRRWFDRLPAEWQGLDRPEFFEKAVRFSEEVLDRAWKEGLLGPEKKWMEEGLHVD